MKIKIGDVITCDIWGEKKVFKQIGDENNYGSVAWLLEKEGHKWGYYQTELLARMSGEFGPVWLLNGIDYSKFKKQKMTNIISLIKSITRTEPEKTFVKVSFIDEQENITEKGKEALIYILWQANKEALKTLADQILLQDKSNA